MSPRQPRIPRIAGRWRCGATALAALALLYIGFASPVSAHVEVDVGDGQYVMEIGFRDEPAFLGQPNAVFVHVERYATGGTEPVEGLAATLTAEVTKDGQTFTPPLVPTGEGSYEAVFVPTALGDYTFRISGTIEDAPVDESLTSGPSTFNSVEPLSAIEFPATESDTATAQVQESLARAQSDAALARTLAIVGIAAGLLGLIVAIVAFSRAGKAAPVAAPAPAAASGPSGKLIR